MPSSAAKMAALHVAARSVSGPYRGGGGGATLAFPAQRQRARCALSQCDASGGRGRAGARPSLTLLHYPFLPLDDDIPM